MPNLFPILIEVEEISVGRVLRKLDTMEGIAHIRLKLREEKRSLLSGSDEEEHEPKTIAAKVLKAQNGITDGRSLRNVGATQRPPYLAIATVLQQTPAHLTVLVKAGERAGVLGKRIPAYVHRMLKWGWIRRTAPGTYAMTIKGEKAFFGSSKSPMGTKKLLSPHMLKVVDNRSGFRHFILTALKKERDNDPDQIGLISRPDLIRVVTEAGLSGANLWSTGGKMEKEGLINFENGFYSITDKGLEAIQPPSDVQDEIALQPNEEGLTANG